MKKPLAALLAFVLFGLAGCSDGSASASTGETAAEETTASATQTQGGDEKNAALTPPVGCEIMKGGFAKTPTHFYAEHEGAIIRAPIDNLTRQTKVPLPDKHDGVKLSIARICGITENFLFVNMWEAREKKRETYGDGEDDYYEYEDYEGRALVTFRIALETWNAEALLVSKPDEYALPWYHPAGDSLLIPTLIRGENYYPGQSFMEAMPLRTRNRSRIEMGEEMSFWGCYWRTTLDGHAAIPVSEIDGIDDAPGKFIVFDENNKASHAMFEDLAFVNRWSEREAPQNDIEHSLGENVRTFATAGEYVYYKQENDLYRINLHGKERKLLRKNSNIFELCSVGNALFCRAWHPSLTRPENPTDDYFSRRIDIYRLDEEGKHAETIFFYWEDTEGNSGLWLTPYGDYLLVMRWGIYAGSFFHFLYDPATGAMFPPLESRD